MSIYLEKGQETYKPIPAAAYYVLSNDRFMSQWGHSREKINTCIVPCESYEMALAVRDYVDTREEQKYVRIVSNKPRSKSHVIYSLVLGWIERAREYSHLKPEFIVIQPFPNRIVVKTK